MGEVHEGVGEEKEDVKEEKLVIKGAGEQEVGMEYKKEY